jgi:hypothetical protein
MFADGGSIVWALRRADGMPIDAGTGPPLLRLSRDGHIENRVAGIASDEAGYVSFSVANGTAGSIIPFYPQLAWTVSPHGMRVGLLTTDMQAAEPYFRVIVVDDRGARVADRSFTFMPEPIPDAVRDSAIHARAFSRSDTTVSRDIESALRDATPRVYPSATQILIGTDDRIWIGMRPTADGTRWRVLSPAGDPQGEILLPPRVRLRDAGAEYVLCTERDEFDVESVVRYRIGAARATDR